MPVSSGSYTVGTGGTYTSLANAFADIVSPLTGNLTLTILSTQSLSNLRIGTIQCAGFTFRITGNVAVTGNTGVGAIISRGSNSVDALFVEDFNNGVVQIDNLRLNGPPGSVDRTRGVLHLRNNAGFSSTFRVFNCIGDGFTRNGRCIRITGGGTVNARIWNIMSRNFIAPASPGDGGDAVFYNAAAGTVIVEHCASVGDFNGYDMGSVGSRATIRNCYSYGGSGLNYRSVVNANIINSWGDGTSITAGNMTNCQFLADPAGQLTTSLGSNYLKLNDTVYTPSLAMDGTSSGITENTASIDGFTRPGPKGYYSIGPRQFEPTDAVSLIASFTPIRLGVIEGVGLGVLTRVTN